VNHIPPCRCYPMVMACNCALSVIALALTFMEHTSSLPLQREISQTIASNLHINNSVIQPTNQTFILEAWICAIAPYHSSNFQTTCHIQLARMWMLVPYVVLTLASVYTGFWALMEDTKVVQAMKQEELEERAIMDWSSKGSVTDSSRSNSPAEETRTIQSVNGVLVVPRLSDTRLFQNFV
jgi:hypothetical protein